MKPFHYHEDPMYAAAAAILAQETVTEEVAQLDEGVEDIAAAVANFKKGDKTNFGVVTDVSSTSISFKAKDLPITKIAFNQRKMGSKDFVLDKLVKLKEGVELEEGVGDYSVKKTSSSVSKGKEDYEHDVTTTHYDILKDGKKVGNLSTNDFMSGVYGKMYGKDLPDLEGYGSFTGSGVLGKLHKFLKSNTGMKWMAKNVKEGAELEEAMGMGTATITAPGNKLHGKQVSIFHKFDDGRLNVQYAKSDKKGDVINLTLKKDQYKLD